MPEYPSFTVEDGWLSIAFRGRETLTIRPDDRKVLRMLQLDDPASAFVLLEWPAGGARVHNLLKVTADGAAAWRAELPPGESTDCFVSVDTDGDGGLFANTWSCYRVTLDPATGRILQSLFTK
jgi:hypothetical protein